jgi:hypothetical protein
MKDFTSILTIFHNQMKNHRKLRRAEKQYNVGLYLNYILLFEIESIRFSVAV